MRIVKGKHMEISEHSDISRRVYQKDLFEELAGRNAPEWRNALKVIRKALAKAASSANTTEAFDIFERMLKMEIEYQAHIKRLTQTNGRKFVPQEQENTTEKTTEPDEAERFLIE